MLSDPIVFPHMTVPTFSAGTPLNFRRVSQGKYVCTDAPFSLDQQARCQFTPTIKATGYSTVRYRLETDKNVSPSVATPTPVDDTLTTDIVQKYNPRSHGLAEALASLDMSVSVYRANLIRLMSGES